MLITLGGDPPEVFAAQVIFWMLLPVALFAPGRWAILAWLLMGNLDTTGPTQEASAQVGWMNAAKAIAIPIWLWWRLRREPSQVLSTLPAKLWISLGVYAAIATLWSPFPIAAIKLVGNMAGIILMVILLEKSVRGGLLGPRIFSLLIIGSLALGVLQTYVYAGRTYGFDGTDEPLRFTSFASAQQYAGYLVAFLALLLSQGTFARARTPLLAAVSVALILNGSRTWIAGAGLLLIAYGWLSFRRLVAYIAFGFATMALGALLLVNLTRLDADSITDSSGRVTATLSAILAGHDTSHNAGLRNLNFRLAMYDAALNEIRSSDARELLFGHGTSSGGMVALRAFPARYKLDHLDPNRTIHDEWLRVFFEWGLLGLALFVGVFFTLIAGLVIKCRGRASKSPAGAVLAALPAFLAAVSTENVIAGAGNAIMMSFGIVISILWIWPPRAHARERIV